MFALVDCNNFYASCERVFRPDLNGKPIVVLSNNDGCVIARSNEAKVLDIPMGAAAFKYQELFEKNNVHVFSSNYALYGDMSNRVMNILRSYCDQVEVYSIDEAFLLFEGFKNFDLNTYLSEVKNQVTKCTGIPVSVGVAPTKALAKVANRIAKKFPEKTKGVYVIDSEYARIKALKWLQIGDVWGIGRQHTKRLTRINVTNAYSFTELPDEWVLKHMTVVGLRLKRELEGKQTLNLEKYAPKKGIACTRSFDKMYTGLEQLDERVSTYAVTCAEKLRNQGSVCNLIMVYVGTNFFRKDLKQYGKSISIVPPFPTNSTMVLLQMVREGLKKIYRPGYYYKRAGVMVFDLTPEDQKQLKLFSGEDPKHKAILNVIDLLNKSIGQNKVRFGCQDPQRTWKMKQERLSPRYTTRLEEIITVKV